MASTIFILLLLQSQVDNDLVSRVSNGDSIASEQLVTQVCESKNKKELASQVTNILILSNNQIAIDTVVKVRKCAYTDEKESVSAPIAEESKKNAGVKDSSNGEDTVDVKSTVGNEKEGPIKLQRDQNSTHDALVNYGIGGGFIALSIVGAFVSVVGLSAGIAVSIYTKTLESNIIYIAASIGTSLAISIVELIIGVVLVESGRKIIEQN